MPSTAIQLSPSPSHKQPSRQQLPLGTMPATTVQFSAIMPERPSKKPSRLSAGYVFSAPTSIELTKALEGDESSSLDHWEPPSADVGPSTIISFCDVHLSHQRRPTGLHEHQCAGVWSWGRCRLHWYLRSLRSPSNYDRNPRLFPPCRLQGPQPVAIEGEREGHIRHWLEINGIFSSHISWPIQSDLFSFSQVSTRMTINGRSMRTTGMGIRNTAVPSIVLQGLRAPFFDLLILGHLFFDS